MRTEKEIIEKYQEVADAIKKGPDNPLQESMWMSLFAEYEILKWILDVKD